jgi:hypothetical protein
MLLGSRKDLGQHCLTVGYWEFPHDKHLGKELGEVPRERGPTKKLLGSLVQFSPFFSGGVPL